MSSGYLSVKLPHLTLKYALLVKMKGEPLEPNLFTIWILFHMSIDRSYYGSVKILSEGRKPQRAITVVLPRVMPFVSILDSFVSRPCLIYRKVHLLNSVSAHIRYDYKRSVMQFRVMAVNEK